MTKPHPFLCIGAAHWDIIARSDSAMDQGADVPGRIARQAGGVALNVARALARAHQQVIILTAIGSDQRGDELIAAMQGSGLDCTHITRTAGATDAYLAIESQGELFGAVADCTSLERAGGAVVAPLFKAGLRGTIIADGNLPEPVLAALSGEACVLVPASPAKAPRLRAALLSGKAALCANRQEAEVLCQTSLATAAEAVRAIIALGARWAAVTDGPHAAAFSDGVALVTATPPRLRPSSATGAGDTFLAALLVALAEGASAQAALDRAVAAASAYLRRPLR